MQGRFVRTYNVFQDDEVDELEVTSRLGQCRKILLCLLSQAIVMTWLCLYGFQYTNQKYLQFNKYFKILAFCCLFVLVVLVGRFG